MPGGAHVATADERVCLVSHRYLLGKGSFEGGLAVADEPRASGVRKTAPLMEVLNLELRVFLSKSLSTDGYPNSLPG